MRFFNFLGNKFFSLAFSWLLSQNIKDTLCGTKVLSKRDYEMIAANRAYFGEIDPFGDCDLIFGAAKYNLKTSGSTGSLRREHLWRDQHPTLDPRLDTVADGSAGDEKNQVYLTRSLLPAARQTAMVTSSRGARRVRPAPCGQLPNPAWLVQVSSRKGVWDAAVERAVEIVYKIVQTRECEARR